MMYHGMVGEITRLLSCSYEKGQLLIRKIGRAHV